MARYLEIKPVEAKPALELREAVREAVKHMKNGVQPCLHYILNGHIPVLEYDLITRARWFENTNNRIVKRDTIGEVEVSTIFLGLDHNFTGSGAPILFETMIFGQAGDNYDDYQERYCTWEEAEAGHERAVAMVRNSPFFGVHNAEETICADCENQENLANEEDTEDD